ncbi:coiled-coil domain-containing protein [Campylobacter insulaenigrae]|uniref:coiled-coil domain-containing protein n=1 Tax=Campylobacter insulaenigrae TaxID=260714 RepID=UPI00215334A9|nr:hypothetical protein [Campylobacter insulaenigrae]MCR6572272.1 hypothetical protein [Campylobacter insulaenigrae]MCR6574029.1 hypothetical protein [Campylobacter insulaenigrae]MCR6579630.1 hypothetical protein [Campylobacter insulaenigrae]MCR6581520.1 hypothetical protein [Campylobacter insulaenigrae]MCR6586243.1 hypothetical protein [Campylobacter insulaenigrae]
MSEFNTYSISIKDKNGMGFEGELINKKEVDHALQNLKSELEKTSNDLKVAQEELKNSKEKLLQAQTKLNTTQDELKAKQEKLDERKEKLKDAKNELEKTQNVLKDEKNRANNFKDQLSSALNELEKTQNELDNIKENTHFSLYKYYQANKENLKEFHSDDFKDQWEFLVKTLDTNSLKNLYRIIETKIEKNDLQYYVDFFEKLYKILEKYHKLERIETKEGEKYDGEKHLKIKGSNQGKIKKILFVGFKMLNHTYHSLVEVE